MPHTQLGIPFVSGSHTSHAGARHAARKRGEKMRRLLDAYREAGARGLIDAEAAIAAYLPIQSVTSLRNSAMHCELVRRNGERMGAFGVKVGVYVFCGSAIMTGTREC